MVIHVVNALKEAGVEEICVVLGYRGELVAEVLPKECRIVYQKEQLGTGHALMQALPMLNSITEGDCLVVCGDTPLLQGQTLRELGERHRQSGAYATVLTAIFDEPTGYGRIIKDSRGIKKIVEEKDAAPEEKQVCEINTATYCFKVESLKKYLPLLTPANAQGEYYLTDVIEHLVRDGELVETKVLRDLTEAMGINNRVQLAEAELFLRRRIAREHMLNGVTIINPEHTYIEPTVKIGQDTILSPGVILEGETVIGSACVIGPNSRITTSTLGNRVQVGYSYLIQSQVADDCVIGPFSYLRPGTVLAEHVKVGDFTEIKKSVIGKGSKVPHLSYVGDAIIGDGVNIGAGTITCNYDGVHKHPTIIGDKAFIGSNTNLVAPITVGDGAYIGAGSTVTKDIPAGALAIARGRQRNIENWKGSPNPSGKEENEEE